MDREYLPMWDRQAEAHLLALDCSAPLDEQGHGTLRLLIEKIVELEIVKSVSHKTVRQVLK